MRYFWTTCRQCTKTLELEDRPGLNVVFCSPTCCWQWQEAHTEEQIDAVITRHGERPRCQWCGCRLSGGYHDDGCPVRELKAELAGEKG